MIVIPTVSIGNVPQLALDLLIYTWNFELVKSLDDKNLCPFIGPVDHAEGSKATPGISTAIQLFKLGDHYLLQLRSPPLPGQKTEFIQSVAHELEGLCSNNDVLIVGSANAGFSENIDNIAADRIEEVTSLASRLPDSGFLSEALTTFGGSTALVSWVYEGDNIKDSIELAHAIARKLGLPQRESLRRPVSWSRVYGKDIPLGIEQGLYT